ncbi:MAG: J domain-containing protein [Myxococcales bacterium]|nr:J domain-containing protein [Myxococcales bacterium]
MAYLGDYYAVLGVARDATDAEVKAAFRKLAHEFHPDRVGDDASKIERFKAVREAYETLADAKKRASYDRRHDRRTAQSPFYGSHWRHAGQPAAGDGVGTKKTAAAGNNINLEDIFNDFGGVDLGAGRRGRTEGPPKARSRGAGFDPMRDGPRGFREAADRDSWPGAGEGGGAPASASNPRAQGFGFSDGGWSSGADAKKATRPADAARRDPEGGDDIRVDVSIASTLLGIGGLVTVEYQRHVRSDDGVSLLSIRELHELRVPPDVREGEELRVPKQGHAGGGGGPYGDLVATMHIVAVGPRMKMPRTEARDAPSGEVLVVDVPFTDAILGGRVEVETPQGRVRLSIPAGSSSGTRFRLRGKGKSDATGQPGDAFAEVRVTVPKGLDEESRLLIEQFAQRNPTTE